MVREGSSVGAGFRCLESLSVTLGRFKCDLGRFKCDLRRFKCDPEEFKCDSVSCGGVCGLSKDSSVIQQSRGLKCGPQQP